MLGIVADNRQYISVSQVAKMMKKQVVIVKLLNAILLYYFYMGHSLHCKVVLLDTKRAYLMFPHVDSIFQINNQKFTKITSTVVSVEH